MPSKIRFIYSVIVFTALVFLIGSILFSTILKDFFLPVFIVLVFYFMLQSIAGRLFLEKTDFRKPGSFTTRYFIVRWLKVLMHLIFIVIFLLADGSNVLAFILTFIVCYILFSVFDIYTLSFYIKKK